jgi:hypothetical protein
MSQAAERVDDLAVLLDGDMDMQELGHPRQADTAQAVAGPHLVAVLHRHAAALHVAILGGPATAMVETHAVAAFTVLDRLLAGHRDRNVTHAVAHADHAAGGRCQHLNAFVEAAVMNQGEVRALVAVIGHLSAPVVGAARSRIVVDIVQDEAVDAGRAGQRQRQRQRQRRGAEAAPGGRGQFDPAAIGRDLRRAAPGAAAADRRGLGCRRRRSAERAVEEP